MNWVFHCPSSTFCPVRYVEEVVHSAGHWSREGHFLMMSVLLYIVKINFLHYLVSVCYSLVTAKFKPKYKREIQVLIQYKVIFKGSFE